MEKLAEYRKKRDFSKTPEPAGELSHKRENGLRYCLQHHLARADHFDLRLEYGGVALSWAVPKGPSFDPKDRRLAVRVEDHPVGYMSFEGNIPKGEYGGGTVMLFDEGTWTPHTDPGKGLKAGSLKFALDGARLKGDWTLVRMNTQEPQETWLLIKERDGFAKTGAGISRFTRGVRSGKTMKEIAQASGNPFSSAEVMLPALTDKLPAGRGLYYELKYDGHRTLAFCEDGRAVLKTRNGHDCTSSYPAAAEGVLAMLRGRAAVLDGEMTVAGEDGLSDFSALCAYRPGDAGLCYVLFDLLALDGEDLRPLPLKERKQKLKTLCKNAPKVLLYSSHREKITARELQTLQGRGAEGIVIKRADSPYTAGKNGDWQKLKFRNERELVIGGYLTGEEGIASLLVGGFEGKQLRYMGKVGTGFDGSARRELKEELTVQEKCPFTPPPKEKRAVWTRPKSVAQVEFAGITRGGLLRQASFKGLRRDKRAAEIAADPATEVSAEISAAAEGAQEARKEKAEVMGIAITHPDKVMFRSPAVTKLDLAQYYAAAVSRMLPFVKDRPLSVVCCPSGEAGEKFFRRHLEGKFVGVGTAGEDFYLKDARGAVSLAQYNVVEFHVRNVKKGTSRPDVLVFDLDPDEGLPLADVRKGARTLRGVLQELGLESFLKTSGGKGYHLVVPLAAGAAEERFRGFARQVAELMERAYPKLFTSNMAKRARQGKIYLDWQRNSRGATSAAPYSVRCRAGAPVSMPIAWEELSRVAPASVTLTAALKRLKEPDPWSDYFAVKSVQSLRKDPLI